MGRGVGGRWIDSKEYCKEKVEANFFVGKGGNNYKEILEKIND